MLASRVLTLARRPARGSALYAGDADAGAYFARFATPPSAGFKDDVNTLVLALKASLNVWAKTDYFTLAWAVATSTDSVLDLRKATKSWEAGAGASFTTGVGWVGSGAAPALLWPDPTLFEAGNNYLADGTAGFMGYRCTASPDVGTTRVPHVGGASASRTSYLANANGGTEFARFNQTADSTGIRASATRVGSRIWSRLGAAEVDYDFDGTLVSTQTNASTSPLSTRACLGGNGASYAPDTFGWAASGGPLDDAERLQLYTAMAAFRTARGIA